MKANSRNANSPPREVLPLPAEPRRPKAAQGSDEGEHLARGRQAPPRPHPPQEEGDCREYYRLR